MCKHIYEYVHKAICPNCGKDTHEPNWKEISKLHKLWVEENPNYEYSWWSI